MPREATKNFIFPEITPPAINESSPVPNSAKLESLRSVISMVLSELEAEVNAMKEEIATTDSLQSGVDIARILKIIQKVHNLPSILQFIECKI
jgi:uncharacterized phage protein gp47/JayE